MIGIDVAVFKQGVIQQLAIYPVEPTRAKTFETWISLGMSWSGQKVMVEILKVGRYLTAGGAPPLIFYP